METRCAFRFGEEPERFLRRELRELGQHQQKQLELCDRLEKLADDLPDNFDRQECLSISWQIFPIIRAAHQFEELQLFPVLTEMGTGREEMKRSIERLKFEHWEDESSAEDLSVSLRAVVSDPTSANFEKLGYMLRGFFEGMRRHIAFETEHLLPQLKG